MKNGQVQHLLNWKAIHRIKENFTKQKWMLLLKHYCQRKRNGHLIWDVWFQVWLRIIYNNTERLLDILGKFSHSWLFKKNKTNTEHWLMSMVELHKIFWSIYFSYDKLLRNKKLYITLSTYPSFCCVICSSVQIQLKQTYLTF